MRLPLVGSSVRTTRIVQPTSPPPPPPPPTTVRGVSLPPETRSSLIPSTTSGT